MSVQPSQLTLVFKLICRLKSYRKGAKKRRFPNISSLFTSVSTLFQCYTIYPFNRYSLYNIFTIAVFIKAEFYTVYTLYMDELMATN